MATTFTSTTRQALLERTGGDAFVRWEVAPKAPVEVLEHGHALAVGRRGPHGRLHLTVLGRPAAAAELLRAHLRPDAGLDRFRSLAVPQGTLALLGPHPMVGPGDDWEWMWLTQPPQDVPGAPGAVAGEAVPEVLGEDARAEVEALLSSASPRHSSRWGDEDVVAWVGLREAGRLVAVAAHTEHVPGVPHLASVAVHPDARGRGLGAAVTAAVSRRALALGAPVVTLGMYSDNAVARRVYERLGFRNEHAWSSRRLLTGSLAAAQEEKAG